MMKLDFQPAVTFRGTSVLVQANNLAYAYETNHAAADADGAPNAYHPSDIGKNCTHDPHVGLDCPENAGYGLTKASWWTDVLVPDPDDQKKAFVQPTGQFAGFFVATTALRSPSGDKFDPATYVDATKVPYIVIPSGFGSSFGSAARPGDVGLATYLPTGATTTFIVGDAGGGDTAPLGEASIALFAALGFANANPRNGQGIPTGKTQYIVFPKSKRLGAGIWPRSNQDIHDQAMKLVAATPGIS